MKRTLSFERNRIEEKRKKNVFELCANEMMWHWFDEKLQKKNGEKGT